VTTFSNARDALDYLDSIPLDEGRDGDGGGDDDGNDARRRLPNAIVSDILMPGEMDGLQFLSTLRGNRPVPSSNDRTTIANPDDDRRRRRQYYLSVPVILLTAKGMTKDRIRGYDAGADGYLPKPFDPEELVGILESAIAREEFLRGTSGGGDVAFEDLKEIEDSMLMGEDGGVGNDEGSNISIISSNTTTTTTTETTAEGTGIVLSMDELDVLELLCQGKMNKEMALELKYSTRWVEGRLTSMFRKTNCSNRTELVRWAVAMGYANMFG